jgi:hypothetical protein
VEPFRWGSIQPLGLAPLFSIENNGVAQWIKSRLFIEALGDCLGFSWKVKDLKGLQLTERYDLSFAEGENGEPVFVCFQLTGSVDDTIGSLLAQAKGQNLAKLIVVNSVLTNEYTAQICWLNQITVPGIKVYGLELDFWRVNQSDTVLPLVTATIDERGLHRELHLIDQQQTSCGTYQATESIAKPLLPFTEFWLTFNSELLKRKSRIVGQKPGPKNWASYPLDDNFRIVASLDSSVQSCSVGLVIAGENPERYYEQLVTMRVSVERELGTEAYWEVKKDRGFCRIYVRYFGYDVKDKNQWPALRLWLVTMVEKFQTVFELKINALSLQDRFHLAAETGMQQKMNWENASRI